MRSPAEALTLTTLALAALTLTAILAFVTPGNAGTGDPDNAAPRTALSTAVTIDEVRAAAAKLRADPNLGGEQKVRTLRWSESRAADQPEKPPPWLEGLFEYLGQTASVLLWVAGAVAAAIAVIWVRRTLKARLPAKESATAPIVGRVSGMDIRPESLPDDVGAAALLLADAGRTRDALSLLYRGALSRAVHRFGVPIGASYTEGEALRAIGSRLDAGRNAYFLVLVDTWRRAVYAGEVMRLEPIKHLCRAFAATLDRAAAVGSGAGTG